MDGCEDYIVDGQVAGFGTGHGTYIIQRYGFGQVSAQPVCGPPRKESMRQLEQLVGRLS